MRPAASQEVSEALSCRQAIEQVWPKALWTNAFITLDHENGLETANRLSAKNYNGTYDMGCMQINTVHYLTDGWTQLNQIYNPVFNAQIAYVIYQQRGWRAWYSVEGILWN